MRRGGDQADVAGSLAPRLVIGADRQEAGILALAAGVGLKRDGIEAGDLAEPGFEIVEQLGIAGSLLARREGMKVARIRAR